MKPGHGTIMEGLATNWKGNLEPLKREVTNNVSKVSEMIASKMNEAPASAADPNQKKMIVFVTKENSEALGNLAKITGTGKIELGSSLLELAIQDARSAAVGAGKMNDKGGLVGAKPATQPSTPPAPPK